MSIADVAASPQLTSGTLATTLVGTYLGHAVGYLPGFVAVVGGMLAIVWYSVMLWESKTVQDWHAKSSARRKMKKIANLKAQEKIITAQLAALEVRRVAREDAADKVQAATADAALVITRGETAQSVEELTKPKSEGGGP
jgi:dipeptide/tripeptide permease